MQGLRYRVTGAPIQVGGLTVKGNSNTAITITADSVIEVCDTSGGGSYAALGTSDPGTVSSSTSGAFYIPPYGTTRPFHVGSNTVIRGENVINVREL